jgi:hypothetical protein
MQRAKNTAHGAKDENLLSVLFGDVKIV